MLLWDKCKKRSNRDVTVKTMQLIIIGTVKLFSKLKLVKISIEIIIIS